MPYSAIAREPSFCTRWEQIQRPTTRHYSESKRPWNTALNVMSPPNSSPPSQGNSVKVKDQDKSRPTPLAGTVEPKI